MTNLRKMARGQECKVRIPGICNFDRETTILAHIGGGGMGQKRHDLIAAHCCSACHDAVDSRTSTGYSRAELDLMHYEAMARTIDWLAAQGIFKGIKIDRV